MMIRHQTRRTAIVASLALAAFAGAATLSGCTSDDAAKKLTAEDSPLYKMFGSIMGLDNEDAMREQTRKVEAAIAQCMKDEGFEYTPTDAASARLSAESSAERETEKWAADHGYGIVGNALESDDGGDADPNQEYLASLSEIEQAAYHEALTGPQSGDEESSGAQVTEAAGCVQKASREVYGAGAFWDDEKFTGLFEEMSTMYSKVEQAPEVKSANAKWADCMADAGHGGMKKQQDGFDSIYEKYSALVGNGEDGGPTTEPSKKELTALHDEEIEMAVADVRCASKVGYRDAQRTVQFAQEEKFIAANKALLDEFVEAYGDKK